MRTIILILFILFCSNCYATVATFQEGVSGYAGTQDATIIASSTNEHFTQSTTNSRDADRFYILQFDVSSIPTSATVSSATLTILMDEQNCTAESVGAHKIANPDSSNGFTSNSASADVFNQYATYRFKNETGSVKWSTGGAGASFTDVDDNAADGTVNTNTCGGAASKSITVTNMVQTWVTTPALNTGMFLKIEDGSGNVLFTNKRDATSSNRPLLSVTYSSSHTNVIRNSTIRNSKIN